MTLSEYRLVNEIVVAEVVVSTHQPCIATVVSDIDHPNLEPYVLGDETDTERTAWLGSLVDQVHHVRVLQIDAGSGRDARTKRDFATAQGESVVFLNDDTTAQHASRSTA